MVALSNLAGCGLFSSEESKLARADELKSRGDLSGAAIELRKVVDRNGSNARAWLLLGQVSLDTGQPAAAEGQLRRALELGIPQKEVIVPLGLAVLGQGEFERALEELEPFRGQVDVLKLRGDAYLALARLDDAKQAYTEVLGQQPESLDARIGLAQVEQKRGNPAEAENLLAQVLADDPDYPAGWLARGLFDLQLRRYSAAEAAFQRSISSSSVAPAETQLALQGLVESQWRQGKFSQALVSAERLLKLLPNHPQPMYLRGVIAYGMGDYATAKDYLRKALERAPGHQPAMFLLGATHYAQGDLEQAHRYLDEALSAAPASLPARKLLAATRLRQQKPQEALAALAAISAEAMDKDVLTLQGEATIQAGDKRAGLLYFERAVAANPSDASLRAQMAGAYMATGDIDHAIGLLQAIPDSGPGSGERDVMLTLAHLRKGDHQGALTLAKGLVSRRPDDVAAINLLGTAYLALGEAEEARAALAKALQLRPDDPVVLMSLGRLALLEGDPEEARARFERVAVLRPSNVEAALALARLSAVRDDQTAAKQWLDRAANADPAAVEPQVLLIQYALRAGDRDHARGIVRRLVAARPGEPAVQNVQGIVQSADGEFEEAVRSFRKAVEASPGSANYTYNLSRAELALQRRGEAKRLLRRALDLQPSHRGAVTTLALLEAQDGEIAQALARARSLQGTEDTREAGLMLEGDLWMVRRDFKRAAPVYRTAMQQAPSRGLALKAHEAVRRAGLPNPAEPLEQWLKDNPADLGVRLTLALERQRVGDFRGAAGEYEIILGRRPNDANVLNNLAWFYARLEDPRALQVAERAYNLDPENGHIADTLGWLLVQKGDLERARQLLEQAARQQPDKPEIRYHLAVALAKAGARDRARATLTALMTEGKPFEERADAKRLLDEL